MVAHDSIPAWRSTTPSDINIDDYIVAYMSRARCETAGCHRPVEARSMGNYVCCIRCDDTHGARHSTCCDARDVTTARLLKAQTVLATRARQGTRRQLPL